MYCAHVHCLLLQVMMDQEAFNHDILECTICQEVITKARVLPCGHSFCHKCLQQCLQPLVHGDDYPCPTCSVCYKVTKDGADAIPKNIFMTDKLKPLCDIERDADDHVVYNEPAQCSFNRCFQRALVYCPNCDQYMCKECKEPHRLSRFTKKHNTISSEDAIQQLPTCPLHHEMILCSFCEDCHLPICDMCILPTHKKHTIVNIISKTTTYKEQLEQILAQIGSCLQEVQQAKIDLSNQADQVKCDVDALKKQTYDAYDVIIQHLKEEQQQQLSEIDKAYEQIEKKISETKHKHEMTETKLCSNMMYGKELRRTGSVYDYITNMKGIKSRYENLSKLSQLQWEINSEWDEWQTDEKGISLITRGYKTTRVGKTTLECNPTKHSKFKIYSTEGKNTIRSILLWRKHLILLHSLDDLIYVYDEEMRLESSVKVPSLRLPHESNMGMGCLCTINEDADSQYMVLADKGDYMWWLRIEEQEGQVKLGEPVKHDLIYEPCGIISDTTGQVHVSSNYRPEVFTYSRPLEDGTCSELSLQGIFMANDLAGGYSVKVRGQTFVWLNSAGKVRRCYTGDPFIYPSYMVYNGTDWLVSDWKNKCVHVVTSEGKHGGYLITKKQGLIMPGPMCVDNEHHCVWLGCQDKDGKPQVVKVNYSTPDVTTLKLSAKLPKMHIIKKKYKARRRKMISIDFGFNKFFMTDDGYLP